MTHAVPAPGTGTPSLLTTRPTAEPGWRPLARRVLDAAQARPGGLAVTDATTTLTYRELEDSARALAAGLTARGVGPGDRVACELTRTADSVAVLLGILVAGAAWVPLDPAQPAARRRAVVARAGCTAIVVACGDSAADHAPARARGLLVATAEQLREAGRLALLQDPQTGSAENAAGPDDLAYVLFTSGSTGEPKGVEVTHANVGALLAWAVADLDDADTARFAACVPFTFDPSVVDVFATLLRTGTLVVLRDALDPALATSAATALSVTPSALRELVRAERLPAELRTVLVGGEVLEASVARAFFEAHPAARVLHCYGPTEVTVTTTVQELRAGFGGITLGRALPGLRALVVDEELREVADGESGELCVAGAQVARGYAGDPEQTAHRFTTCTDADGAQLRAYRTGDRARRLADGDLQFLGRLDRQVKVRGYRVELGEVEAALAAAPGTGQSAVALDGSGAGARLVAWTTPAEPTACPAQLREGALAHVRATLPGYMVPSALVVLDRMPLTTAGKVDVGELVRSLAAAAPLPAAIAAPAAPTALAAPAGEGVLDDAQRAVTAVVAEVLGLRTLPAPDDLVINDLGATSLQLMEVTTRLQRRGGVRLDAGPALADASVADLAGLVRAATAAAVAPGAPRVAAPPAPRGRRWWGRRAGAAASLSGR